MGALFLFVSQMRSLQNKPGLLSMLRFFLDLKLKGITPKLREIVSQYFKENSREFSFSSSLHLCKGQTGLAYEINKDNYVFE